MQEALPPSQAPPCILSAWQALRRLPQGALPPSRSWAEEAALPAAMAAHGVARMHPHLHAKVSVSALQSSCHMAKINLPSTVHIHQQPHRWVYGLQIEIVIMK